MAYRTASVFRFWANPDGEPPRAHATAQMTSDHETLATANYSLSRATSERSDSICLTFSTRAVSSNAMAVNAPRCDPDAPRPAAERKATDMNRHDRWQ